MRVSLSILWGLFCACSWTWCIGMFLPKLMIERWGWWGFIAFAVPNVIGCAAFGYVVRNRARSEAMVVRHRTVMTWFSAVTVAYHIFFLTFIFTMVWPILRHELAPMFVAAMLLGLAIIFSFLSNRDWLVLSVVVYAVSITTFAAIGSQPLGEVAWSGAMSPKWLAWLTPMIWFGFLVCPYLDLTFHRAIQHSPSRHAFGVFGVTFSVMIVLTIVLWIAAGRIDQRWFGLALAHVTAQCVFTMGAHLREIRLSSAISDPGHRWLAMLAPLVAAPMLFIARMISDSSLLGENMYIGFVSLFGSVFPLWFVWQAIEARRKKTPGRAEG